MIIQEVLCMMVIASAWLVHGFDQGGLEAFMKMLFKVVFE
jgi:hypothetical protein